MFWFLSAPVLAASLQTSKGENEEEDEDEDEEKRLKRKREESECDDEEKDEMKKVCKEGFQFFHHVCLLLS